MRTTVCIVAAWIVGGTGQAAAWELMSVYPEAVSPAMPSPEEARRLAESPPGLLLPLREAHRSAAQRGWIGIPASAPVAAGPASAATAAEGAGGGEESRHP